MAEPARRPIVLRKSTDGTPEAVREMRALQRDRLASLIDSPTKRPIWQWIAAQHALSVFEEDAGAPLETFRVLAVCRRAAREL